MLIGVIIPTLNEEIVIEATLRAVLERGQPECLIVADCNSHDRTTSIAKQHGAVVIGGPHLKHRAAAMNEGAAWALKHHPNLDALWFLHADSMPPTGWDRSIGEVLEDERFVGGAFDIKWSITGVSWFIRTKLRIFSTINRTRFRLTHIYFGDQGIFVRPEAFLAAGRLADVALLEDVILSRKLKKIGRTRLASGLMRTNPRRFLRHGVCRQVMIDVWILLAERIGFHPARLYAWYNHENS